MPTCFQTDNSETAGSQPPQPFGAIEAMLAADTSCGLAPSLDPAHEPASSDKESPWDAVEFLSTRGAWMAQAAKAHEAAARGDGGYSILKIDVDHLKAYNQVLGRNAGDQCRRRIAECVHRIVASKGLLVHVAGGEFELLFRDNGSEQALELAEQIRSAVWDCNLPHPASPTANRVTVSIGLASYPARSWENVESRADEALYVAKILGRNVVWGDACRTNEPQAAPQFATILVIDDDAGDAELLRRHVDMVFERSYDFFHCPNLALARPYMKARPAAIVFLDYRLGAETGLQVLREVRREGFAGPIIVATGQGDESTAADILRAGADDYVPKNSLSADLLKRVLRNASARFAGRCVESRNRHLLAELQTAARALESKNRRLMELYQTAHQFVDNVSHEFRTPLSVIKEFTSILRDGLAGPLSAEQTEYLDIVLNRTDDLGTMIEDMLDSSKLEAGMLGLCRRRCSLAQVLDRVRTTLERKAAAAHMSLEIRIADDLPDMYCDCEKVGRVLINLTVNAVKYCPEGSTVSVRAEPSPDQAFVLVHVEDNGPGICPEDLRVIFDRFRQVNSTARTSTKGFGLGLSIVKQLVQLHLGEVNVSSTLGQGSVFTFSIPVASPENVLRVHALRHQESPLSMLVIISRGEDAGERARFGDFLERQLRYSDLLFQAAENRWLLIACAGPHEIALLRERLQKAIAEANRNRPSHPIPAMTVQLVETYYGAHQHKKLQALVGELLGSAFNGSTNLEMVTQELCHAEQATRAGC